MEQQTYVKGYITILSVLIVSAILSYLAVTLLTSNINSAQSLNYFYNGSQNYYIANSCLEEVLYNIKQNSSYSTSGNLNLYGGTCSYTIVLGTGELRTINITSTYKMSSKKIKAYITTISPKINISYIEEVLSF